MKMTIKLKLILMGSLLLLIILITTLLLLNSKEVSSPLYYPYSDAEYLGVWDTKECSSNKELEQLAESLIISSFVNSEAAPQAVPDFISNEDYLKLRSAASIPNGDVQYNNYHCSYIESLCADKKCIIAFETSFVENYYCDRDSNTYYNKIYLKKGDDGSWNISEVYISPTG